MKDFDVIVAGAGPAGAASAIKCAQLGFKTLLIERGSWNRHKTCGGVLPLVCADILEELELKIPSEIMCDPPRIGLFYVPPSGRSNGGYMENYRLLNIRRDLFDQWLRDVAGESGVEMMYKSWLVKFRRRSDNSLIVRVDGYQTRLSARYIIGADGVHSTIRKQLYPDLKIDTLMVLQEQWRVKGDFAEYFYAFFRGDVTPGYAYVIPKDGLLVVGIGCPEKYSKSITARIDRFKRWLADEFSFKPISLDRREAAAVPYGITSIGEENVILVGDAAGFCNPFSGEGIRLAIESGIAAGESVKIAESCSEPLSLFYAQQVKGLCDFIHKTREFATSLTDEKREGFIRSELTRISF